MIYRLFFISLVGLILFAGASAQSPNKILKQAEKALGGAKALKNLKSRQKSGLIVRLNDGAEGNYVMQTGQPNFYYESFDLNGFEIESAYNGKSGWRRDSRAGLRTLTDKASRDFQAESAFRGNLWLDYKKEKVKITSAGTADVNGRKANVLNYTNPKGVTFKLYFDAFTDLLLREEIPADDLVKTINYGDYRPVNGVKEAFQIDLRIGEETFRVKFDQIVHNQNIAANVYDFPKLSGEPLPDIPALLLEIQANEDRVEDILDNYSFTQKIIKRELGKDGILRETESVTLQQSFYKGFRISRVIEKDGKPLSESEQKDADRNAQKRAQEIEKRIAKQEARTVDQSASGTPDEESRRVSIAELMRASLLVNPRRERFRGRDVIVFDFEPNPNFDYKNAKSFLKFFGKTAGVMWVDEKDKQVARIEAYLADSFKIGGGLLANLKKGASFVLEQERVNDEIWLPSTADINLSVKVFLVKGININQVIKAYNYRKFKTEVKDARVNETCDDC